jgi:hypothetical protein
VGLAGFACGAVIGFKVPWGYKTNLVTPPDPVMARALRDLLRQAESALGSKVAAENWVFTPHPDLGWITPAEAAQYKTHATGVKWLLESEAAARREQAHAEDPSELQARNYQDAIEHGTMQRGFGRLRGT